MIKLASSTSSVTDFVGCKRLSAPARSSEIAKAISSPRVTLSAHSHPIEEVIRAIKFWQKVTFFFLFLTISFLHATLVIDIESPSAFLVNETNGKVIFKKNASQKMYPASCTKMAFALYAIKYHQNIFNKKLICSQNALKAMPESQKSKNNFANVPSYVLETDASHMGLKVGEEMLFYDLLMATLVVSADDASNVIAEAMGEGSIEKCVEEVNRYLHSIGCKDTYFKNPHGLHHPDHVSTAEDLARMCQEAMKEPIFKEIIKMDRFQRPSTNKQAAVALRATNKMITKSSPHFYSAVTGGKTGYHRRAGHCLTVQGEKNGRSLISVILQAKSGAVRFQETKKLFETAFQETKVKQTLIAEGPQLFSLNIEGGVDPLTTSTQKSLSLTYYPSEKPIMRCQLLWNKLSLPVNRGTEVGELVLYADNEIVQREKLYASNNVEATFFYTIKRHLSPMMLIGLAIGFAALLIFMIKKIVQRSH